METNVKTNPALPALGKELLRRVSSKEITMQDFNKECAYWMMGDISTMFYKGDIDKPSIISEYEEEKKRDYKYQVSSEFWNKQEVREYLVHSRGIHSSNHANWYWLHFIKNHIPVADTINQGKIARAMASYKHDGYVVKDDWRNR
jgi:hypothetical protein